MIEAARQGIGRNGPVLWQVATCRVNGTGIPSAAARPLRILSARTSEIVLGIVNQMGIFDCG